MEKWSEVFSITFSDRSVSFSCLFIPILHAFFLTSPFIQKI